MFKTPVESMSIKQFMSRHKNKSGRQNFTAYSIGFTPLALIDPFIVSVGIGVLTIVFVERLLTRSGMHHIADMISGVVKVVGPVAFFAALIYFFMTNPFSFL